ncbi:hypothetical protein PENCOP_c002G01032 [Penicillium coprophilum]|uniref:Uncharacterized protein n=1 Tax=Penicillium coprophilum TaxID=36646 RepID=A0A1V6V0H7_9EURO|nr:hypothetical protein PENCOP_c002G01032 [Penicillium coprophilum]
MGPSGLEATRSALNPSPIWAITYVAQGADSLKANAISGLIESAILLATTPSVPSHRLLTGIVAALRLLDQFRAQVQRVDTVVDESARRIGHDEYRRGDEVEGLEELPGQIGGVTGVECGGVDGLGKLGKLGKLGLGGEIILGGKKGYVLMLCGRLNRVFRGK